MFGIWNSTNTPERINLLRYRMNTRMNKLRDADAAMIKIMEDLSVSLGEVSVKVQRLDEATQAQLSALESTISSINPCKCETGKAPKETPVSGKASPRSEASSSQDLRRTVSVRRMGEKQPWNPFFGRG